MKVIETNPRKRESDNLVWSMLPAEYNYTIVTLDLNFPLFTGSEDRHLQFKIDFVALQSTYRIAGLCVF